MATLVDDIFLIAVCSFSVCASSARTMKRKMAIAEARGTTLDDDEAADDEDEADDDEEDEAYDDAGDEDEEGSAGARRAMSR
jgi:hypothetical protein